MPVEAAVAAGTMEITVSKFELLRELTATQGVVERKTTIPIAFQLFIRGRGRPPVAHRYRPRSQSPHVVQRQSQERRLLHHPRAQTSRLREAVARRRDHH